MRTHYTLKGSQLVANSSVEEAKRYRLPSANYIKVLPIERKAASDADNTLPRLNIPPFEIIDARLKKW